MTGPEFATAHGNDSSTWTTADIEAEINLAEIDALPQPVKSWMAMTESLQADIDRIRAARNTQTPAR